MVFVPARQTQCSNDKISHCVVSNDIDCQRVLQEEADITDGQGNEFNAGGDGQLCATEQTYRLKRCDLMAVLTEAGIDVSKLDKDNDGDVSQEEILKFVDKNNDKILTREEFITAFMALQPRPTASMSHQHTGTAASCRFFQASQMMATSSKYIGVTAGPWTWTILRPRPARFIGVKSTFSTRWDRTGRHKHTIAV